MIHVSIFCSILGTYKLAVGNWAFFAFVLDGLTNQGTLHLDSSYGFNDGSTDFKVSVI